MQNLKSYTADGWQFAWDATSVSSFEKCPRFYQLKLLEGWQPKRKSVHLIFGGHFAKALERFHKYCAEGMDYWDAAREVVHKCLIETFEYEDTPEGKVAKGPWNSEHNVKTRDTLIRSIIWYLEHFQDDQMKTLILANGKAAVELSFSFDLDDDLIYCGHIDRMVVYGEQVFVQDQKTSGSTVTAKFFNDFKPDVQMGGYSFAGGIIFDKAIAGVSIDAAQIAVGFTEFSRGFVDYVPTLVEEWRENTLATIKRAKQCHEEGFYPMTRTSCGNYGGCEFRKICSTSKGLRDNYLRTDFEQRDRWDPLERR